MAYRKFKITMYLMVVLFYACIAGVAKWYNGPQMQVSMPEDTQLAPDSTAGTRDIHTIITWEPQLKAEKDIPTGNAGQRYAMPGSNGLAAGNQTVDETLMLRTDVFAEFIKRFNADSTEIKRLKAIDFTQGGALDLRQGCILSLVNDLDVLTNATLREFAQTMVTEGLVVDMETGSNMAAVATIAYSDKAGEIFPVRLTLRKDRMNGAPVWYLTEAESPYFTCGDNGKPYYIDNTEPEMKFMGLTDNTDRSAASIAGPDFKPDGRTAFLTLTSTGHIQYHWGDDTSFVIWAGDYTLLVEHIESFVHKRSGFLITRILKGQELIFENR